MPYLAYGNNGNAELVSCFSATVEAACYVDPHKLKTKRP